jgi:anti-sigma factor (TIGR02949 family)
MSCDDVKKFIQAYLDGELDEHEWAALADHLESCVACRREALSEERLRRAVRSALPVSPAPASLKVRVRAALDSEDAEREEQESGLRRWTLRLVPAAALVALGIGFLWSRVVPRERPPSIVKASSLASLAEQSIEWHRLGLPMDVTASNPEAVQRYFSDKVPFAVRPPIFLARQRAQLLGARLANLREHRAVFVTYQLDGRRVSVFIFDSNAVPAAGGRVVRVGSRDVRWQDLRGYNVALYTAGGTGYAVTSDLDPGGLVQLIAHSH